MNGDFPSGNANEGEKLFAGPTVGANNSPGCVTCHSAESDVNVIGPSQVGLATLAQEALDDPAYKGQTTTVEGYLWETIVDPKAYLRSEYADVMYKGYTETLTEQEIADLVAYMMTLE
ncbi:c-type cytochrome [Anaerolineales bacterium HSG25]|nr:c-type cytochrome [Anaerolineales bacterium HSG25]